jgi:hypothetical protein
MDKKIIYGIGGVAVIGIIAYLYNKKKKDDALKITTMATPPSSMETIVDMGGMTPTLLEDSMVVMPDGSIVDGSVIALETNPTSIVYIDPIKVTDEPIRTSPVSYIDPKNMTTAISAPARFDSGFANAIGSATLSKECYYVNEITGYYPSGHPIVQKKLVCKTATAKFDGGFQYADGFGVDPVLGF